ncbi:hypothetical protein vseg_009484 [Gypsophila vaccaria]
MARVLLTCFAPSMPSCTNRSVAELFSSVAIDLQRLQESLEQNPPNLQWCREAMLVVKKTHRHFLEYLERTKESDPWEGVTMADEYMNASLDLLDLCNLLKSAITSVDRQRIMVDFMVKNVKDGSFMTMADKIELERNETEKSNNIFKFRKWREMNINERKFSKVKIKSRTKMHVFQPISSIMSILSLFIFCSILHPIPIKIHKRFYRGFQNMDLFSESVRKLAITFGQKLQAVQGKGKSVLHENAMIQDALAALTAEFVSGKASEDEQKLAICLDRLKNSSLALKQGIDSFESVVNELFEDVIKGRKRVISLITTNNQNLYDC